VESAALSAAKRALRHTKLKKVAGKRWLGARLKKPVPPKGGTGEPQKSLTGDYLTIA
jgi:hypothetical protein